MATNIAAATGVDAVSLAETVISAARNANTHKRNCQQLADHVRMISNLVEKLKCSEVMKLAAIKEPVEGLEEALRKGFQLVESCKEKSYLYMLAMGWSVVYQFKRVQTEIDRFLELVPLISLVHDFRMQQNIKEGLEAIKDDQREYTLDEEDVETHNVILKPDRTKRDANILEKSLSRRYPDLDFHEALKEEKQKLNIELQRSRTCNDIDQCCVIEHLIDVTEHVVNVIPGKNVNKQLVNEPTYVLSGYITNAESSYGDVKCDSEVQSVWKTDLFDCCEEPCLSQFSYSLFDVESNISNYDSLNPTALAALKTCIYPCGTLSSIANLVSRGKISREQAVNNLVSYSIFCGCCCYSCCIRMKIRKIFNIEGGSCDDFLTHLMCCSCALVQEWRELELRHFEGCEGRKMIPPPYQFMNP